MKLKIKKSRRRISFGKWSSSRKFLTCPCLLSSLIYLGIPQAHTDPHSRARRYVFIDRSRHMKRVSRGARERKREREREILHSAERRKNKINSRVYGTLKVARESL
jgi:hypothetical protein